MRDIKRRDFLKAVGSVGTAGVSTISGGFRKKGNTEPPEEIEPPPVARQNSDDYATIRVPSDYPTIQDGVNNAQEGDMVLVDPGVYEEEVSITTPGVTVRGLERNEVILDGNFNMRNGIEVLETDGVVLENMTPRHYEYNGFFWTGVNGYRGSYLTAYNNGDYGIYAFDSVNGRFEHSYASGHPDSGFYIGQCNPCHAVITDVIAENNAIGYSGTNASNDITIKDSVWRRNMSGIVPNTLDSEKLAPQRSIRIANNEIHDNNNANAPTKALQYPSFGTGVTVAGGVDNIIEENEVRNHMNFGVSIIPMIDKNIWISSGNIVRKNEVRNSGRADLALAAPAGSENYFEENDHTTSRPVSIEEIHSEGSLLSGMIGGDSMVTLVLLKQYLRANMGRNPSGDWKNQPEPDEQESMPNPTGPPKPAVKGCCDE
ncbi:MAG: right-handed parallel beta-helix repeat-containing protein [Halobacteria archaeon]|nr:right-handed parallel beta-helix repeat-containing protein [Halobacteria archaeon]